MSNPVISVILPVFNAEKYLLLSIESILNQTFCDIEIIIIDDGSTDSSLRLLERIASQDTRVNLVARSNKGLVYTLNEAISMVSGDFIARMDADDISKPSRLAIQLNYLLKHPDVDVVGCDFDIINSHGKFLKKRIVPKSDLDLFFTLCYTVPFAHPSVLIRRSFFDGVQYSTAFDGAVEDYELWTRCYRIGSYANVGQVLLEYRVYNDSFSFSKSSKMYKTTSLLAVSHFERNVDRFFAELTNYDNIDSKSRACAVVFLGSKDYRCKILSSVIADRFLFLSFVKNIIKCFFREISCIYFDIRNILKND